MPEHLFVVGLGRSGTTALTHVLASHAEIVLGIERYKLAWRPGSRHLLGPELFEKDRFFDFADGLTNVLPVPGTPWHQHYMSMRAKFDGARYVGDKVGPVRIQQLLRRFPGAKIVCIVREVYSVAYSWEQRASDPNDTGWSSGRGAEAAPGAWNDALTRIDRALRRHPEQVSAVAYDEFFSGPGPLSAVVGSLGLAVDADLRAAHNVACAKYFSTVAAKDRRLPDSVTREIAAHADWDRWDTVLDSCRR